MRQVNGLAPYHPIDPWRAVSGQSAPVSCSQRPSYQYQTIEAFNKSGEAAYRAGDLDHAADLFRQDSNYGQAYSNLGLTYQKLGRTAEAIWANRKAIALAAGPNANTVRASSYFNIAKIYEAAAQYQDALNQYQLAKQQKNNPVYDQAIERVKAKIK